MLRAFLLPLLLAGNVLAATTNTCQTLYVGTGITASPTTSILPVSLTAKHLKFIATATNNSGSTPTLDAKIQHCRQNANGTCSTTCTDTPIVFTQCTTGACYGGDSIEHIDVNVMTVNFLPCIRAVVTLGGSSPNYDAKVEVCTAK